MGTVRRIDLAWLSLAYGTASLVAAALLGPLVWTTLGYTFRPEVPHLANLAAWFALPAYVAVGFALWPPTRQRMRPLTKRPFRAASVLGIGLAALALPATIWTYGEMPASPGFRRDLGPPGNKYGSYSLQSVVKMACGSDLGESLGGNLYAYVSLTGTGDLIQLTYPRGYVDLDTGEGLAICPGGREVEIPRGPIPLYMDDAALTTEDAATRMILWFSCAEKWDLPGMTVGDRDAYGWPLIDRGLKVGYGDLDQSNPDDPVIRCSPN